MNLEINPSGTFTYTIEPTQLARGLRPSHRIPRNSEFLTTCDGAVGRDGVLCALDELSRIDTSIITDAFPFPQVFVFTNYILICSLDKIYEYNGDELLLKYTATAPCNLWEAVDFYNFIYLTNGKEAVVRNADTGIYSLSSNLPFGSALCNYNGQVLVGAPNTEMRSYGYQYIKGTKWTLVAPKLDPDEDCLMVEYNEKLYIVSQGILRVWNEIDAWKDVTDALPEINPDYAHSMIVCGGRIYYSGWSTADLKRYVVSWGEGESVWTYQAIISTEYSYQMALVCYENQPYLISTENGFEVYTLNHLKVAGTVGIEIPISLSNYISGIDFDGHLWMYIYGNTKNSLFRWSGGSVVELWEEAELIDGRYITPHQFIRSYDGCLYSYEITHSGWPVYSQLRKWNGSAFERVGNIQEGNPYAVSGYYRQLANCGNKLFMIGFVGHGNSLYYCDYDFNWIEDVPDDPSNPSLRILIEHKDQPFALDGTALYRADTWIKI